MNPVVSIIIPAYNKGPYIRRAVMSALRQSFSEIEVIVVDDASTDLTCEIVNGINDDRLKLVRHNKNLGSNHSRISGLKVASGAYIQFMDADDRLEPEVVERMLERHIVTSADIVVMASRRVGKYVPLKIPFFIPSKFFGNAETAVARSVLPVILSKEGFSLSLADKMYSRRLLDAVGVEADKEFIGDDMLMNIRIFNSDARIAWTDYVGYNWTTGGGSTQSPVDIWEAEKRLYIRCRELLKEIGADTEAHRECLAKGLAACFRYEIARSLVNPFASAKRVKKWIAEQLDSSVWDKSLLGNEYPAIVDGDVDAVFKMGKQQLSRHRLFYTVMALI